MRYCSQCGDWLYSSVCTELLCMQPNRLLTDQRGHILKVGDKVAYNASGTVAYGVILDISDSRRYDRAGKVFHVAGINDKPSKVTSCLNLMAIFEDE